MSNIGYEYANKLGNVLAKITRTPDFSAGTLADYAGIIAKEGCIALGTSRVGIWSTTEETKLLKSIAYYDMSMKEHAIQEDFNLTSRGEYKKLLLSERLIVINDIGQGNTLSDVMDEYGPNICSMLDAPIRVDGKLAGVVCIEQDRCGDFPEKREWTIEEQNFASSLADFMALAITGAERLRLARQSKTLMDNLPGMVYQCINDPPNFTFTFVSDGCCELTGYTPEELLGNNALKFFDMVHPGDVDLLAQQNVETLSIGLPLDTRFRIIAKDGREKWIWVRSHVVEKAPDGTPYLLEGFYFDITEKRLLEASEAAAREQASFLNTLKNILNNLDAMVCVTVPDTGEILFANNYMKQHYGISEDVVGQICYEVFQNLDSRCSFCPCDKLDKEPDSVVVWESYSALTNRNHRNTDRYIKWIDGETVHLQHSVDVTELIAAKELAEQSSRYKSSFLAKMSHEIRTPMNAILGMTELALREDMSDVARGYNVTIKQAGSNLLSIINDILDFSRIESGQLEILPDEYVFSSLANDVVNIIKIRALDSRLRLAVNVDCDIPNMLFGDVARIRQIMLNLLCNAVKYTEKGFISLCIDGEITDGDTVILTITVEDSGIGIKEENIEKLFDEFSQFDLEKNKNVEGTGLGLAITSNLVRAMGGTISVKSEYGKGSTFTVTLPQEIRSRDKTAAIEHPEEKNVLVFERREICQSSIIRTMDSLGVVYKMVSSASDFNDEMASNRYAFVFVASALYEKAKKKYKKFDTNARIVLIAEFGEVVADKNISVLTTPIFCIPVANILNGVSDNFTHIAENDTSLRFHAPEARVLIVDDINTNLKVTEGLMAPYHMRVDLCLSGKDAIKAVKQNSYDLVFMDHMMPEMNGMEAVAHIRALGEGELYNTSMPIIALTANAVSGTKEMFLQNGFDDFLSKPIDTVKLNAVLEKWIPKEKQQKQAAEAAALPQAIDAGIEIEGIDIKKGIAMTGGILDSYLRTLAIYHEDGRKKVKEITDCLNRGDMSLYTIYVHAIKGASASIGAGALAEGAEAMEAAAQRGDMSFIRVNNGGFLKNLESLLNNIEMLLSAQTSGDLDDNVDMELLKAGLSKLKTALNDYDAATINESAKTLQKFTRAAGIGGKINKILQNKLIGEYDEAIAVIDEILEG